jgi:hypothetical protein
MKMTYEQIERIVCRKTDELDNQYGRQALTEAEYRTEIRKLDRWFETECKKCKD